MLQGLVSFLQKYSAPSIICSFFASRPVWGESDHLDTLWKAKSVRTIRRLGTIAEAMNTLCEAEAVFQNYPGFAHGEWGTPVQIFCLRFELENLFPIGQDQPVGDVTDVSRLSGKRLRIGYTIEEDPETGLKKEQMKSRESYLAVLRRDGLIVSAYAIPIMCLEV